jgi:hypothetical protein
MATKGKYVNLAKGAPETTLSIVGMLTPILKRYLNIKNHFVKKALIYTFMTWGSIQLPAQITVTASTFPAVGDVLHYVQAANPGMAVSLYTPPGGNQYWDLSALTPAFNFETNFLPAAQGVYANNFPGATMVVLKETDEYYYSSSGTKFEHPGVASDSVSGLPLTAIYYNAPVIAERHAPLNFFDIYQQSTSNLLLYHYSELPGGAVDLPVTPDSVRIRISRSVVEVVDAWGVLRLPGELPQSEFPVLRLKKTSYLEQRIDAKISPLGWLDVTDNVVQSGSPWAALFGVDTIVTHHYFNDIAKEEIASLTFNTALNEVIAVAYKNTADITSVNDARGAAVQSLQVYPNPAGSTVTIRCTAVPSGIYTMKIFNCQGTLVTEDVLFLTDNKSIQVALHPSMNGLNFCRLEDAKGKIVGTGQLVVIQ